MPRTPRTPRFPPTRLLAPHACPKCVLFPAYARRASMLESAKGWLGKWKAAEARLRRAKTKLRSARARARKVWTEAMEIWERGNPGGAQPRWIGDVEVREAEREVGRAIADVEKKRDAFASCARWMLEGKP